MAWQFVHYEQVGRYFDFGFLDTTVDMIAAQVDYVFRTNQNELEAGQPIEGQYGIGNDTAHIFFGIFVRRFKFKVNVWQEGKTIYFRLTKGMSGAAAGLLGISRMNGETSRISGYFHGHFSAGIPPAEIYPAEIPTAGLPPAGLPPVKPGGSGLP